MFQALTNFDLRVVQESWIQEVGPNFGWTHLPLVRCLDARHGYGTVSYRLPAIDNMLRKTGAVTRWEPGDALPQTSQLREGTVTFESLGHAGRLFDKPIVSSEDSRRLRFLDYQRGFGQTSLVELASAIEVGFASLLQNTTVFGTQVGFSGTNTSGLNVSSDHVNQNPIGDIQTALQPLRWLQDIGAMKLCFFMNPHVADVLSRHPSYTGAGHASVNLNAGMPSAIVRDAFLTIFKSIHRVDDVILVKAVGDTVVEGQTSDPNYIHTSSTLGPVFSALLMDPRSASWDLRPDQLQSGPDGAIALAYAAHEVSNWVIGTRAWIEEGLKVERYRGEGSWGWVTPRYTAFAQTNYGVIFRGATDAGVQMGVFDTAP